MTLGAPRSSGVDALIAPGTALFFSIFVAFLAPHYPIWFGDALPALTRGFLAAYPIWIALTVGALLLQVWLKVLQPQAPRARCGTALIVPCPSPRCWSSRSE